jgi:hypothetical protein
MRKILLILLLSLSASLNFAQDDISPELAEQSDGLESATESLRGLDSSEDVALAFPSREDVGDYLEESFEDFYTPEIVAQEMAFYSAFGFIPADYDLVAGLTELYSGQVAGYYDTETETMNVINTGGETPEDSIPLLDEIIYVHEYTHALQDLHFNIDGFIGETEGDALLAKLSLIEGDATAVMSFYVAALAEENPVGVMLELGVGIAQMGNISIPAGTPRIIAEELNFPYIQGQSFVTALLEEGGWDLVNAAYNENPPQSSEQILHPEAYLAGDAPQDIRFNVSLEGWELAKEGVFGEFYLREWLRGQGLELAMIRSAATGWGGDYYQVFSSDAGSAYVLQIVFDTNEDQTEFLTALETITAEYEVLHIGNVVSCWQTETVFCTAFRDGGFRLSSAPTEDVAMALLNG